MNNDPVLYDDEIERLRQVIAGYLDLMADHFAKMRRGALRRSHFPRETTPADLALKGTADSAACALRTLNYMHDQLRHKKNILSAYDRTLGKSSD